VSVVGGVKMSERDNNVWYGMVYINLYSAIVANVSYALRTLVPRKQPSFQTLFEPKVLLCVEVVRQ